MSSPVISQIGRLYRTALATNAGRSPFFTRLALAVVMFPHGAQKLLGWFDGYGFSATLQGLNEGMGIPLVLALGVILIEFFGPILLLLGLATRPAALALGVIMTAALFMVQLQHGFFMNWSGQQAGEGIQFTLLFLGAAASLIVSGGGLCSLDHRIANRGHQP